MNAIRHCPFSTCQSTDVRVNDDVNVKMFAVVCDACGSRGPFAPTESLAVDEWNSAGQGDDIPENHGSSRP